jgi:hypothetical protein
MLMIVLLIIDAAITSISLYQSIYYKTFGWFLLASTKGVQFLTLDFLFLCDRVKNERWEEYTWAFSVCFSVCNFMILLCISPVYDALLMWVGGIIGGQTFIYWLVFIVHKTVQKMWEPYNGEQVECSICLDCTAMGLVILKCKHVYHEMCIEEWLKVKTQCPLCRVNVPLYNI